ncbi:MAG TPA: NAD(P)-dependent oxidoreductase [Actinopolymorphaceae bacterium]
MNPATSATDSANGDRPGRLILVTGAAGRVAQVALPALADYRLRLLDRVAPDTGGRPDVEITLGDIAEREVVGSAVRGVDTVVHLAANPSAMATWDELREPNIEGTRNVLAASVAAGVRRVVLASSVHAAGAYFTVRSEPGRESGPVDPDRPSTPCCQYGATKAFAEALGRAFSYRTGLSVLCLRFGGVTPRPDTRGGAATWIGPEDTRQLVVRAIEAPAGLAYGVYHGISRSSRYDWDLSNAERDLGYVPMNEVADAELEPDEERWLCRVGPIA